MRDEKAHRHRFDAVRSKRDESVVPIQLRLQTFQLVDVSRVSVSEMCLRICTHSQQSWYAWSVDVGVEDANGTALSSGGEGEVDCDCAFADAALGTADSDQFADIGDGSFLGEPYSG